MQNLFSFLANVLYLLEKPNFIALKPINGTELSEKKEQNDRPFYLHDTLKLTYFCGYKTGACKIYGITCFLPPTFNIFAKHLIPCL
ncbi:hypothetical protein B5G10_02805 [Barnesiella sp. An55]|nr:hypothetical protein B5G10_02805 [Barnesiella sp. An55]